VKDAEVEGSKGQKQLAHKVKTGGFKRESVAKERLFHQNLKKTSLVVDNLGLGRPLPLEVKMVWLA
jgi:hypothetical protein